MTENKTKPTGTDVDAFIETVDHPTRKADAIRLKELMTRISGEEAVLWGDSLIGFGTYHYKYESGREGDFFLTGFSPRKTSLSLYIQGVFPERDEILSRLGKHKTGRACVYVNKLADVDLDVLEELISTSLVHMRATYG